MHEHQVFSHATAARLYELPLPAYLPSDSLHVTVLRGARPPEVRGVVGHELDSSLWATRSMVVADGAIPQLFELRAVAPSVAWAQLASHLDVMDLVALGDAIVAGDAPLASLEDLECTVRQWRGRRGAAQLARAIAGVRVGSRSRPEPLHR